MKIDCPGVFDLDATSYHADPCPVPSLSSSILKIILAETPQHVWVNHPKLNPNFEAEEEDKFDLGKAAHSLMLGDPIKFAVLDFDDWRTKAAKEAKDAARAAGKLPMLTKNWERVNTMVAAGRAQLANHADASDAFTDGKPEQTLVWQEGETWCRARLDWLADDRTRPFDDFKSTGSANPEAFQRIAYSLGSDIQAAFYRRGIRAVLGVKDPIFRFIVQEVEEPFALTAIELNEEAMDLADYQVDAGLARWRWCMERNEWPGYPARTCIIGPPKWRESQILDREEAEAGIARKMGVEPGPALLEQSMRFQAPI